MGLWSCEVKWKSWEQCYLYLHCWLLMREDGNRYNICTWLSTKHQAIRCSAIFVKREKNIFVYSLKCLGLYNPLIHSVYPRPIRMRISYDAFVYLEPFCLGCCHGRAKLMKLEADLPDWVAVRTAFQCELCCGLGFQSIWLSMTASPSVVENKGAFAFSAQPLC